jgi:hypothetical protein
MLKTPKQKRKKMMTKDRKDRLLDKGKDKKRKRKEFLSM